MDTASRRFCNLVCLVTGANRGIGRAIARRFAAEGARVGLHYREDDAATKATVSEIEALTSTFVAVCADVANECSVQEMIQRVEARLGPIDVLVNNAGTQGPGAPLLTLGTEAWDQTLRINLSSAFFCSRAVIGGMVDRRSGKIVNVASIAARQGYPQFAAYSASKAGLLGLSRSLALEVARFNVQVNAIAPGITATRMAEQLSDAQRAEILDRVPLRRMAHPDEVAALVAFLASKEANYITGQCFDISGGRGV